MNFNTSQYVHGCSLAVVLILESRFFSAQYILIQIAVVLELHSMSNLLHLENCTDLTRWEEVLATTLASWLSDLIHSFSLLHSVEAAPSPLSLGTSSVSALNVTNICLSWMR